MRECETEKKRVSALWLCFSVEFVCWLAGDEEKQQPSLGLVAGIFDLDYRQMLVNWQTNTRQWSYTLPRENLLDSVWHL